MENALYPLYSPPGVEDFIVERGEDGRKRRTEMEGGETHTHTRQHRRSTHST